MLLMGDLVINFFFCMFNEGLLRKSLGKFMLESNNLYGSVVEAKYECDVNHNWWIFREARNAYCWSAEYERMRTLLFCSF